MSDVLDAVLADLRAEGEQLQQWVSDLTPEQWATKTTDEGWTVAHQVAHLMWTDEVSVYAATDKEAFDAMLEFSIKLIPYKGSDKWIEPVLGQIFICLQNNSKPLYLLSPDSKSIENLTFVFSFAVRHFVVVDEINPPVIEPSVPFS